MCRHLAKNCFWYVKDTNLKPIHNYVMTPNSNIQLFLIRQRYKFETNSQHIPRQKNRRHDCFWYVKDTNLKPIHNTLTETISVTLLFLIRQRYKFETNSQPPPSQLFLSAIVSDTSKIQIWNQFTTLIW